MYINIAKDAQYKIYMLLNVGSMFHVELPSKYNQEKISKI